MEKQYNSNNGLNIAGLVLGITSALTSFIPCIGLFAIIPAIVGIILSAIGLSQAKKENTPQSMPIAGLICAAGACIIAGIQYITIYKLSQQTIKELKDPKTIENIRQAIDSIKQDSTWQKSMDSLSKALKTVEENLQRKDSTK